MNYETFQPSFNVEEITPEYAQEILDQKNNNNRTIKQTNLNRLVKAIDNDEWQVTNQGIAFDSEGNLLDGQHRLLAIVKTGQALKIMVARNMHPEIFNVVDTGTARMASDVLHISGCGNSSKTIAAAIKNYIFYKKYPSGSWSANGVTKPSHFEILETYNNDRELWDEISTRINSHHCKFHFFNKSVAIVFYKLALEKNYSKREIEEFLNKFYEGSNLDIDNPMLSFRNQLMQKAFRNRGSNTQRFLMNCFIRLFNMYLNDVKKTKFMAPPADISEVLQIQKPLPHQTY
tara:strand:- start:18 stop:884 length:867 start_codon:yes stop_codon:yes gene_type:complete